MNRRRFLGASAAAAFAAILPPDPGFAETLPPAKDGPFAPEAIRADFRELYSTLKLAHHDLYARTPKRDYDRLFAVMLADMKAPETRARTAERFQRFVAFGKIAHARIDMAGAAYREYRAAGGAAFPLGIRALGDKVYVRTNASGLDAIAPGDEIVLLNGVRAADWLRRTSAGLSADSAYMANAMLEWRFPGLLWLELGPVDRFAIELRDRAGSVRTVNVPARTAAAMESAAKAQPPAFELDWEGRSARMLEGKLAYLRPGPFYNGEAGSGDMYDSRRFREFIDRAFADFLAAGATRLLLDIRDNPGGDNSFSDYMVAWFATRPFRFASSVRMKVSPQTTRSNRKRLAVPGNDPTGITARLDRAFAAARPGQVIDFENPLVEPRSGAGFRGSVHVLVNRHSWSNATTVAALIQDYGFGIILGEETADLATTYGGMESFTLPRTGIEVGYPKSLIIRPNGSLAARGVVPNVAIATPIVETADDPVLRQAAAIARLSPSPSG